MLTLTIRTENAAFEDDARPECARILRLVADALERGTRGAPLHDINGNRVGRFDLEDEIPPASEYRESDEIAANVSDARLRDVRTFRQALDLAREIMPDEDRGGQLVAALVDSLMAHARSIRGEG